MLIYEVTAVVEEAAREEFERWMAERHIPDVLATGKFAAAFFAGSDGLYRVGYHCNVPGRCNAVGKHHRTGQLCVLAHDRQRHKLLLVRPDAIRTRPFGLDPITLRVDRVVHAPQPGGYGQAEQPG